MRDKHAVWPLTVRSERVDGVVIMTPAGRLGAATAPAWKTALEQAGGQVVLDMAGVDYVSSAGILALSACLDERTVVVCGLSDAVRLTLDLAGVLPRIGLAPSREAALAMLSGRAGSTPLP